MKTYIIRTVDGKTHRPQGTSLHMDASTGFTAINCNGCPVAYFASASIFSVVIEEIEPKEPENAGGLDTPIVPQSWTTPVADLPTGREPDEHFNQEAVDAGCPCSICENYRKLQQESEK